MGGGKRMLMHVIEAEEFIRAFSWSSRLNADWDFLLHLCNMGRARADQWLKANFNQIGVDFTVDLDLCILMFHVRRRRLGQTFTRMLFWMEVAGIAAESAARLFSARAPSERCRKWR